jgi:ribonuclease Z
MAKITFLGTASAVPDKDHENAHLIIDAAERVILVDCAGNPVVRLDQAGINPLSITDIILTHFHPDHVSGLPLLLMDMWLMRRKAPIHIYGLSDVINRVEQMMALFNWGDWDGFYPVNFHMIPEVEYSNLIDTKSVKLWASPVNHSIPAIGIRLWVPTGTMCYSSDTAPCDALLRLAEEVDVLVHEATGEGVGHTSPEHAGEIAQKAGAKKLILIHYSPKTDLNTWVDKAKQSFEGDVFPAKDFMTVTI